MLPDELHDFFRTPAQVHAMHGLQDPRHRVLERNVQVGDHLVAGRHGLQQILVDAVGVGVEKAHPAQPVHRLQGLQKPNQSLTSPRSLPNAVVSWAIRLISTTPSSASSRASRTTSSTVRLR